jgi:hypothetical protein
LWVEKPDARTAQFAEGMQADLGRPVPSDKTFRFPSGANQRLLRAIPSRQEGRFAIVTNAGWDAVDAAASKDERCWFADGEVVWS